MATTPRASETLLIFVYVIFVVLFLPPSSFVFYHPIIHSRARLRPLSLSRLSHSLSFALCGGFGAPTWVKVVTRSQKMETKVCIRIHLQLCWACHPPNMFLTSKFNYLLFFPTPPMKLKLVLQIGRRLVLLPYPKFSFVIK
jgi:hypothetical protein